MWHQMRIFFPGDTALPLPYKQLLQSQLLSFTPMVSECKQIMETPLNFPETKFICGYSDKWAAHIFVLRLFLLISFVCFQEFPTIGIY